MKKALVLSLAAVLCLGVASFAQTFSGSWATDLSLGVAAVGTPAVNVLSFGTLTSILNTSYTITGWKFAMNTIVTQAGLTDVSFDINGTAGAFALASFVDFNPAIPQFTDWESFGRVSLAGVDVFSAFALQSFATNPVTYGSGFAIGGHAVAGSVEVWGQVDFNLTGGVDYYVWDEGFYGWDYLTGWDTGYSCRYQAWMHGAWDVQTNSCTATWSGVNLWAFAPLGCLNMYAHTTFSCAGWGGISFGLNNVDLGAGWFQLDDLDITFTAAAKSLTSDFTLTFAKAVCVTPYFDLLQTDVATFNGIELRALLFSYTFGPAVLKAGELFVTDYYKGFMIDGTLTKYATCAVPGANEYIGLFYSSDGCCGGKITANVITFFETYYYLGTNAETETSGGLFDFVQIHTDVSVGISTSVAIRAGLDLVPGAGISSIKDLTLGWTISW